jgi:hypothetical protein
VFDGAHQLKGDQAHETFADAHDLAQAYMRAGQLDKVEVLYPFYLNSFIAARSPNNPAVAVVHNGPAN